MHIKFNEFGNLSFVSALREKGVTVLYFPITNTYMANFAPDQKELYECAKKILERKNASTLQLYA